MSDIYKCDNDKYVYDLVISFPKDIKSKIINYFNGSKEKLKKFIVNIIARDDLIMAAKGGEDLTSFLDFATGSKINYFPKWVNDALSESSTENTFKEEDLPDAFINLIINILTDLCGCNVIKIDLEGKKDYYCVLKVRLNAESLTYYVAQYQIPLNLQFDEEYLDNVKAQLGENHKLVDNKMKNAKYINELNNYDYYKNGFENFVYDYPFFTRSTLDMRFNMDHIDKLYLQYPLKNNKNLEPIFKEIEIEQGSLTSKKRAAVNDLNPLLDELNGFTYGIPQKTEATISKYISQKDRILVTNKVINEFLNIDWLLEQQYVKDYTGLHHYRDMNCIIDNIATWSKVANELTDQELTMINYYFGSEIAHYFGFLNKYTNYLKKITIFSAVFFAMYMSVGMVLELEQGITIYRFLLSVIFSMCIIPFCAYMLMKFSKNEVKLNFKFGETLTNEDEDTEISSYEAPVYYDPLQNKYRKEESSNLVFKLITYFTLVTLISILISIVIQILQEKATEAKQFKETGIAMHNYMAIGYGIANSIVIKVFAIIYNLITSITSKYENYRYYKDKYENMAMKAFIFNYFNCFFTYWYLAFLKRSAGGCRVETLTWFDGKTVEYSSCMLEVTNQLMIQTVVLLVLNLVEVAVPYLKNKVTNYLYVDTAANEDDVSAESVLKKDLIKDRNMDEISNDYLEIMVQFGLIFTFGVAYPLCFFFAWINNLVEMRVDIIKLAKYSQRGLASSRRGIGIYNNIMFAILALAIVANFGMQMVEIHYINEAMKAKYPGEDEYSFSTWLSTEWLFLGYIVIQNLMTCAVIFVSNSVDIETKTINRWQLKDSIRVESLKHKLADGLEKEKIDYIMDKKTKKKPGQLQSVSWEKEFA